MNKIVVHAPLNSLSIGQVSYNILRELYKRKIQCVLFPRSDNFQLNAYPQNAEFEAWLKQARDSRLRKLDRKLPTLNIWHIGGSESKLTDRQFLFTFHETSSPTEEEVNIVNQQEKTFFSSNWSVDNFKLYGANNVEFVPLGFDEDIVTINERLVDNDITHWVLVGKAEQRKNTDLIIRGWIEKYGGNMKHRLSLLVVNPFFQQEQMNGFFNYVFQGRKPANVQILPYFEKNSEVNQVYNSADIDLSGFSSSEGWGLPAFNMTALGKWSIVTNCSAHKDWATAKNSILVESDGKMKPVYDNIFFVPNLPFNQGNVFDFNKEQLFEAFARAEKVAKTLNTEGLALKEKFSYSNTVEQILSKMV